MIRLLLAAAGLVAAMALSSCGELAGGDPLDGASGMPVGSMYGGNSNSGSSGSF